MLIQEIIDELEKYKNEYKNCDLRVRSGPAVVGAYWGVENVTVGCRGVEIVLKKEPAGN